METFLINTTNPGFIPEPFYTLTCDSRYSLILYYPFNNNNGVCLEELSLYMCNDCYSKAVNEMVKISNDITEHLWGSCSSCVL